MLVTVAAMVGIGLAAPASGAPYSNQTTVAGSTTTPTSGGTMTLTGTGMTPGETVDIYEESTRVFLGSTRADTVGDFTTDVRLSPTLTGAHIIVAIGKTSGHTASFAVNVKAACSTAPFPDVSAGHAFCGDITWLKAQDVTRGYADGQFHPTAPVSRQAMAAFLYRLADGGKTAPACKTAPFTDVATTNTFCGAISWLKTRHITTGFTDHGFHPAASISREAMAAFLYRSSHSGASAPACTMAPFRDVAAGHTFCGAIAWLKAQGISTGYSDGDFLPGANISREAMAAFLHRIHT